MATLKWKCRGGGTVISGFGPLLVVAGLETTELTSLSSNQAFTFTSLTWIFSRKNGKTVEIFNAQYTEMWLLVYVAFPLAFPASFGNLR